MPWCETCSKFWAPTAMNPDGSCPTCGRVLDRVERKATATIAEDGTPEAGEDDAKTPWHFWLLVIGVVLYLGWRLIQLVVWAVT